MTEREKIFADILTSQGRKWIYNKKNFKIGKKMTYRPDFYLPDENLYIEVVGSKQAYSVNKHKYTKFKRKYREFRFEIRDFMDNPYRGKGNIGGLSALQISMSSDLKLLIKIKSYKQGKSIRQAVTECLERWVKK